MSPDRNGPKKLHLVKLTAVTWIHPFFGLCWTGFRILVGRGRWLPKLFAFSIFGNLLFVFVLILGYYESIQPGGSEGFEGRVFIPGCCVARSVYPLHVCEAPAQSEIARIFSNTLYVEFAGIVRARFEFADEEMSVLREVTVADEYGRPWVDTNLEDGTMIYQRYSDDGEAEPAVGLHDKDADGIPDVMIDWRSGASFQVEQELTWRRIN